MTRDDRRKDAVLYLVAGASILIFVGMLAAAVILAPKILSTDSNTDALNRNTSLTSCRAQYSARLTDATTELSKRNSELTADKSDLDVLTNQLVRAIANQDREEIAVILAGSQSIEGEVKDDAAKVREQEMVVDARSDAYQDAVRRAVTDPDKFLADCKAHPL